VLILLQFNMKFTTGETVVTFEKLWYLQRAHAERYARLETGHSAKISLMAKPILEALKEKNWINHTNRVLDHHNAENYVVQLVQLDARNYTNASAFVERNTYFFQTPDEQALLNSRPPGRLHHMPTAMSSVSQDEVLHQIRADLELIPPGKWTTGNLRDRVNTTITERAEQSVRSWKDDNVLDLELARKTAPKSWSKLIHSYIRWAILAGLSGPDGAASMQLLGREETLARLANAARILKMECLDGGLDAEITKADKPK
jgi:glutamyl-tRNA synthetase